MMGPAVIKCGMAGKCIYTPHSQLWMTLTADTYREGVTHSGDIDKQTGNRSEVAPAANADTAVVNAVAFGVVNPGEGVSTKVSNKAAARRQIKARVYFCVDMSGPMEGPMLRLEDLLIWAQVASDTRKVETRGNPDSAGQ